MKALFLALALTLPFAAHAQEGTSGEMKAAAAPYAELLGELRFDYFGSRTYVLPVRSCRRGEAMSFLKLRTLDNFIQIDRLEVTFSNGYRQALVIRPRFNPNDESRWIDLGAPGREGNCVRNVLVTGRSNGRPGRGGSVQVYGIMDRFRR